MEGSILPTGEQKKILRAVDMNVGPEDGVSAGRAMAFQEDRTVGAKARKTRSLGPAPRSLVGHCEDPKGRVGEILWGGLSPGFLGGSALHQSRHPLREQICEL